MGRLTVLDWAIIAIFLAVPIALLIVVDRVERAERRKRRAWARRYFHEGGLIRSLITRWRGPPRLTDQRRDRED